MWWLTFPFSLPSFSLPFFYSSFLFTLESSFPSDSSDLYWKWKQKKFLMVLQGIKVWSLSGLSSGSSLKFNLSRVINFLMSLNNTNSLSNSNVIRKSSDKRISIDWTPYSLRYCHNTCVRTVKRVDFNILEVKGLIPLKSPMVLLLPKLFSSPPPPTKFL